MPKFVKGNACGAALPNGVQGYLQGKGKQVIESKNKDNTKPAKRGERGGKR